MSTHTAHSGHSAARLQGPTAIRWDRGGGEGGVATRTLCRHRRAQACVPQGAQWPGKGLGHRSSRTSSGVTPPRPPAVGGASLAPSVLKGPCSRRCGDATEQRCLRTPASGAGPERRPPFPWASCPLCSCSELPANGEHRTESLGPADGAQMCTAWFSWA